jgi:hypothetical protein
VVVTRRIDRAAFARSFTEPVNSDGLFVTLGGPWSRRERLVAAAFDAFKAGGWKTGWLDYRRKRFWAWVAIVLYTLLGFFVVPWIARGVIVDQIHKQLGLDAKLDKVEFNPYALTVRLNGFAMNERSGRQMIAFDEVDANLQLSSLFRRAWTFAEIRIVRPYVRVEHNEGTGTLNLLQLVPPPEPHAKPEPASPPPRLIVDVARIEGGRASVADKTERQTYETELGPVDLTMIDISTLPNREGEQILTIRTGFGGKLEWKGDLGLEPFRSNGHVAFDGEQLAPITAYLPPELKMIINDGRLEVAFDYKVAEIQSGVSLDVSNLAVKLAKLGVAQTVEGTPTEWLSLDELVVDAGRFEWPDKKFTAQRIALTAPKISMGRGADQRFIWERLWQEEGATATPSATTEPIPSGGPTDASTAPTTSQPADAQVAAGGPPAPTDQSPVAGVSPPPETLRNGTSGVIQRTAPAMQPPAAATAPDGSTVAQPPNGATQSPPNPAPSAGATPLPSAPAQQPASPSAPAPQPTTPSATPPPTSPWAVEIARFEVSQGRLGFADQGINPAGNVGVADLGVTIERLTLADGASMPFTVNFSVDGGGTVALNGTAIVQPNVLVDAQAKVTDLALAVANPYVNADTYLQIAGGNLGLEGHLISTPHETLSFDGALTVANLDVQRTDVPGRLLGWKGLDVSGLTLSLVNKHVDLARVDLDAAYARVHVYSNRVLNFATVMREAAPAAATPNGAPPTPNGMPPTPNGVPPTPNGVPPTPNGVPSTASEASTQTAPRAAAQSQPVAQPAAAPPSQASNAQASAQTPNDQSSESQQSKKSKKQKRSKQAQSEQQQTASAPPAPPSDSAAPPGEPPWSVKLGRMKVTNADVDYTDDSLPIPFSRSISKLSGGIDAFDTESSAPTQLNLAGQVGEFGAVKVSGTLRALDPVKQTNINASFKNLDMPGASAYSIRFAGRKVASGRLDVDMHYVLRDGMLDGDHKIVVHDFQLGEKVPYPEALDLPYDLAISLLKDSSGNINVDLPVEGNVNDPTFKIGGIIMRALANLITQIITSPFRLLGRLVGLGDSEGFDQVLFEAGSADVAPPEREKIAKVSDALVQRPKLAVLLHGVSNEVADSQALRAAAVRARLDERVGNADAKGRLKIVQKMVNESIPGLSLDTIKAQYTTAPAPDAKAVLDEGAYMNALVEKLVAAEPLPAGALDTLASARATAVHDALTANTQLDASRVTIGDTKQALLKDNEVPLKLELAAH